MQNLSFSHILRNIAFCKWILTSSERVFEQTTANKLSEVFANYHANSETIAE